MVSVVRVEKRTAPLELSTCKDVAIPPEKPAEELLESDLANMAIDYQAAWLDCRDTLGRLVKWLNAN